MRSLLIVRPSETLDLDAGFGDRGERLHVQALIAQPAIEALRNGVLPGTSGIDIERRCLLKREPSLDGMGDDLWAIVAAQIGGRAVRGEEPSQHADDARTRKRRGHLDRQTFARELIDHRQQLELGVAQARVIDEVVRPDVAGMGGSQRRRGR